MTFSLELLPAREGDCVLLSYADGSVVRRVLIDGGRLATWRDLKARLLELPEAERELELLVITHVDRDHIEGVLTMLEDTDCPVKFKDIWFNGYGHLKAVDDEDFGAVQGERLTELLLAGLPWNRTFAQKSVRLARDGTVVAVTLSGGLRLTLLSPSADKLVALRDVWEKECRKAGLVPTEDLPPEPLEGEEGFGGLDIDTLADERFAEDGAEANGSSIALLAEYDGRRVLLGADAHPSVLLEALAGIQPDGRVRLDAFKVAHHGSRNNLSIPLLERIDCAKYLISTNGSYFKHPSRQAIARIVKYGGDNKEIVFNYETQYTQIWDEAGLKADYGYSVRFGNEGSVLVLL